MDEKEYRRIANDSALERRRWMIAIIHRLESRFHAQHQHRIRRAFPLLIATILSQNTSDRNSSEAFENLKSKFDLTPEKLAGLRPSGLKPLIEIAGLYEVRSRRIIEVSKAVLERFNGNLDKVLSLPTEEARRELMKLNGVGPKTADVVLAFGGRKPVMPVDTNIFRVSERIGFAHGRNYEVVRATLEELIPKEKIWEMHFALIKLGREICKPRRPLCPICPINNLCHYKDKDWRLLG